MLSFIYSTDPDFLFVNSVSTYRITTCGGVLDLSSWMRPGAFQRPTEAENGLCGSQNTSGPQDENSSVLSRGSMNWTCWFHYPWGIQERIPRRYWGLTTCTFINTGNSRIIRILVLNNHLKKCYLLFNFFFNHINSIFLRVKKFISGTAKVTKDIVSTVI